jgi:4-hydroxy-3-polyprenylbenzoate decarboxylase
MAYKSLQDCIDDLDKSGQLIRIKEEVDPYLEMAAIHLRIFEAKGKAILFEKVKGSNYQTVSNLFGTTDTQSISISEILCQM